jgi:hypothetical protein
MAFAFTGMAGLEPASDEEPYLELYVR